MEEQLNKLMKMHLNPDPASVSKPSNNDMGDMVEDVGEEYQALDSTLDQLAAHLDLMEQQNDDLYAKFQDLLQTNQQTRAELEAERLANTKGEEGEGPISDNDESKDSAEPTDKDKGADKEDTATAPS